MNSKNYVVCLVFLLSLGLCAPAFAQVHHQLHGYPEYPKVEAGSDARGDLIRRGEYLVKAGDCIACHTAKDQKHPFSGGLGMETPFGTIFSPNLTPDKKTGIGTWTQKDFNRAMRQGISPQGSYYFPVFPYPNFHKLSDEDLSAIFAYLQVLPPVVRENKSPEMMWPFRWRFLQLGWRMMFFQFQKSKFTPDPKQSARWNRGAYLVQGLGHCSMCHTPLNLLGGQKKKYFLKGGFVDGFHAPDISNAVFKDVPLEKIVKVFEQNQKVFGGRVLGPMDDVNHDSLRHLKHEDLLSIATYIKSVKSAALPAHKPVNKVSLEVGKKIYNTYCSSCHTTGAGGAPKTGDVAAWAPRIKLTMNTLTRYAIKGIRAMPPKGGCTECSNAEIQSAVEYMVQQSQGDAAAETTVVPVGPKVSLAEGKKVYEQVCSICHEEGRLGAPVLGDKKAWAPRVKKNIDRLIHNTLNGYNKMPKQGACVDCTPGQVISAVLYMVQESAPRGDYSLWGKDHDKK